MAVESGRRANRELLRAMSKNTAPTTMNHQVKIMVANSTRTPPFHETWGR
jgi:hypothetical protein